MRRRGIFEVPSQEQLNELASELFMLFARCEYALKCLGFIKAYKNGMFELDWDAFSNLYGAIVFNGTSLDISDSVEYLLNCPPQRQIIGPDGKFSWAAVSNSDHSVQALFGHVRRVRNNLFHGGKFGGERSEWVEVDRSYKLINAALTVLKEISRQDPVREKLGVL